MLDNNLIQSTSSWPFVEIRKLLKDRKDVIKKNYQTIDSNLSIETNKKYIINKIEKLIR